MADGCSLVLRPMRMWKMSRLRFHKFVLISFAKTEQIVNVTIVHRDATTLSDSEEEESN